MGHKSVRECQKWVTSAEFQEWQAFYLIEPFDNVRADYRAGVIAATLANINKKKNAKTVQPGDFFPMYEPNKRQQTWEDQLHIVEALNAAFGGIDKRKKPLDA